VKPLTFRPTFLFPRYRESRKQDLCAR